MKNTDQQILPRDFKGIWIPREIWLHSELTAQEKLLWAEINSLDRPDGGCIASNEYFCKFFNCRERELQRWLAKLKNLGLVKIESFNGRRRILKSFLQTTHDKFDTSAPSKMTPLPRQKCHPSLIGDSIERENKVENKDIDLPPLPPPTKEEEEEIFKRLKERPKECKPIGNKKRWREEVLKSIREDKETDKMKTVITELHRSQAIARDGHRINGDMVTALKDRVEFTCGSQCVSVSYDLPDDEWTQKTRRWFK